jgi:hypothetical protein
MIFDINIIIDPTTGMGGYHTRRVGSGVGAVVMKLQSGEDS